MFEKVNRSGLIIYLYYNRDAKKTAGLWRYYLSFQETSLFYNSYVPTQEVEQLSGA